MSTKTLIVLTTIIVGVGSGAVTIWAGATQTDLGAMAYTFLGMGVGQLAILLKSPLGKGE